MLVAVAQWPYYRSFVMHIHSVLQLKFPTLNVGQNLLLILTFQRVFYSSYYESLFQAK